MTAPTASAALLGLAFLLQRCDTDAFSFLQLQVHETMTPVDLVGADGVAGTADDLTPAGTLSTKTPPLPPGASWNISGLVAVSSASSQLWHGDIFPGIVDKGRVFLGDLLNDAPPADWMLLFGAVAVLLVLDAFVMQPVAAHRAASLARAGKMCSARNAQESDSKLQGAAWETVSSMGPDSSASTKTTTGAGMGSHCGNLAVLAFWVVMGGVFNVIIGYRRGLEGGLQWCSGYLLEWLLSMDNLFVFHLIFRTYATPRPLLHRALFLGIIGAVAFRMCFFMALSALLHLMSWVRFIFGVLLIYSGVQAALDDDDDPDVENTMAIRFLKRCLGSRLIDRYDLDGHSCFLRGEDGRLRATLLVPVIFCLEITDIFFAIDSVSAKVAQIPDYYIAYSSSVIAIFGLRAMFFVIQDLVDCFGLLKYGLCFILVFIGIELIVAKWVELPAHVVCVVILTVFVVCTAGSMAKGMLSGCRKDSGGARQIEHAEPSHT
eukprot:CAMPEP_0179030520 /NCGR_PEP_ID=MMETSP0796-20121207/10606_1 /TAXON_ID=73915 /ORGANISM="Pyrodinium bahamense, Strain pbaha01" /LENGTH=489 /DNA_ID=CAMNT_0020726701 /DNA_START=57 /DNA_END=1526 /DNA_ORIENTATION=+